MTQSDRRHSPRDPVAWLCLAAVFVLLWLSPTVVAAQGNGGTPAPGGAAATTPPPDPPALAGWVFSGDFRFRYENTTRQKPTAVPGQLDPRHRAVVRFRGGLTKKISEDLDFGVRLATGSRGDPNTTDITLGDFADKLEVSLDRVYFGWTYHKHLGVLAGKFVNPFLRTELVWDDDVNLQGVAGSYTFGSSKKVVPKFTSAYYIVDENSASPDSYMVGGQMQVRFQTTKTTNVTVAGAYYDYTIKSLTHADAGDILSNRLNAGRTAYLSDFNLMNVTAVASNKSFGDRWPVNVTFDWVRNRGALASGEDEGMWLDATFGRASAIHDTRLRYGFARAETDAVLAAFSNDNTTFATNYVQHTVGFDFVSTPNASFNVTWYLYRRDQLSVGPGTGAGQDKNYVSRLRLNALISF